MAWRGGWVLMGGRSSTRCGVAWRSLLTQPVTEQGKAGQGGAWQGTVSDGRTASEAQPITPASRSGPSSPASPDIIIIGQSLGKINNSATAGKENVKHRVLTLVTCRRRYSSHKRLNSQAKY